jgi:hypothetical protein
MHVKLIATHHGAYIFNYAWNSIFSLWIFIAGFFFLAAIFEVEIKIDQFKVM